MSWPPDGNNSSRSRHQHLHPSPRSPVPNPQQQSVPSHGVPSPSRTQFFFGGHPLGHPLSLHPHGSPHHQQLSPASLSPSALYQDIQAGGSPSSSSQGSTSSTTGGLARGSSPSRIMAGPSASSRPYKVCGVCGDRAKSYHFGGISCDSCKAFFRRSVQNEAYRNFHCPYDGRCEITIGSRKCCQYCRFQKCLSIGMEKGWVMTEEERVQLLKNRMEKKQREQSQQDKVPPQTQPQTMVCNLSTISSPVGTSATITGGASTSASTTQSAAAAAHEKRRNWKASSGSAGGESSGSNTDHEPDLSDLHKFLSNHDVETVERLVNAYEISYRSVPLVVNRVASTGTASSTTSSSVSVTTRTDILEMFFTVIKQFAHFARQLDSFDGLPNQDQEALLRCGVLELCFIRGAHVFDETNFCWSDTNYVLSAEDLKKLVSPELHDKHLRFVASIKDMDLDEPTIMLLLVIVLLSPDRPGLSRGDIVSAEQEKYYTLLRRYMSWRYGVETTSVVYPKLLLKLPDLRELSDAHTDFHLCLEKEEMEEIQQRLSMLRLEQQQPDSGVNVTAVPVPMIQPPSWTLRSYLATLIPPSPGSIEDESCSSDSSERTTTYYRVHKDMQ